MIVPELCRWSQSHAQLLGYVYFRSPIRAVECHCFKEVLSPLPRLTPCSINCRTMPWLTCHSLLSQLCTLLLPRVLSIGMGVVAVALAMPRPCQQLSQDLLTPRGSLSCPGISLSQENPLSTAICPSTANWTGSSAAPLGEWLFEQFSLSVNIHAKMIPE